MITSNESENGNEGISKRSNILVVVGLLMAFVVGGVATTKYGSKEPNPRAIKPTISTTSSVGTRVPRTAKPYDAMLRTTLKSVASYWEKSMPESFGSTYKPLAGGIYAYSKDSTIPPCGGVSLPYVLLQQNAFYCPDSDFIAWDDQGLFPRLEKRYGPFLLSVVLAHEWGHAIQDRADQSLYGVSVEQQADCFAGSWSASLNKQADPELAALRDKDLDRALSGFVEFRDRLGMTADDFGAHGTAFDRIRAFQDGFDGGADACAEYENDLPTLVAIPYRSFKERFRGGDLPYDQVIPVLSKQMNSFWQNQLSGSGVKLQAITKTPPCSTSLVSPEGFSEDTLAYCSVTNTVYFRDARMKKLYEDIGDFAVGLVIALDRSLAFQQEQGRDISRKDVRLRAICDAGSWAGSLYQPDNPELSILSPGDIDEAVRVLLETSTKGSTKSYGSGFQQVAAFRRGVLGDSGSCDSPVS
jgi:predicted metalloprotease